MNDHLRDLWIHVFLTSEEALAVGEEDEQAHYGHALKLKKALDKKGHPYRWLTKRGEEHGFYKEENQLELYQTILDFLADNSG